MERGDEEETLSDYEEEESKESFQNFTDHDSSGQVTPIKLQGFYQKANRFGPSFSGHVPHAHYDLTPSITDLTPSPSVPPRDKRYYILKQTIEKLCDELVSLIDVGS